MSEFYRQRVMTKGSSEQVSWIPERYAKTGKVLELQGEDEQWENGWVVTSVGPTRRSLEETRERSQDYKKNRQASDV